jgi:hypothetical protein
MKATMIGLFVILMFTQSAFAQNSTSEQDIIKLSKDKWQWMSDKNVEVLAEVGGNDVTNPFMVTEVYIKQEGKWKLGSLSFTRLITPGDH